MNKNKRLIIIALITVVLAACLTASTSVVAMFIPADRKLTPVAPYSFRPTNDAVGFAENVQYGNDRLETIMFKGWAFIKGENGKDKRIRAVLDNDVNAYVSPVAAVYNNALVSSRLNTMTKGEEHSFNMFFSTLNMKNGRYKLLIEITENGKTAVLDTGRVYEKFGVRVKDVANAEPCEVFPTQDCDAIIAVMEAVTKNEKGLQLGGSAYHPDFKMDACKLYIEATIANETVKWYRPVLMPSLTAVEADESTDHLYSLFDTSIFGKELQKNDVVFRIIIEHDNVFYRSNIVQGHGISDP